MSGKFRCFSTAWIFIKKLFSLQRPPPWGKNNVAPRLQSVEEHPKLLEICCGSPVGNGFSLASSHRLGERTVRPAHFARPEWSDGVSHPSVEVIWFKTQVGLFAMKQNLEPIWCFGKFPVYWRETWQQCCLLVPKVYCLCQTHRKAVLCFWGESLCTLVRNKSVNKAKWQTAVQLLTAQSDKVTVTVLCWTPLTLISNCLVWHVGPLGTVSLSIS